MAKHRAEPASQKIYNQIKQDIIDGVFEENEILTERTLVESYKVSRTPIKEALKILAAEGWVEILPRSTTRVTPFGKKEFRDVLQIRLALESMGATLAATKVDGEDARKLREMAEQFQDPAVLADSARYGRLDHDFHFLMLKISGNAKLVDLMKIISSSYQRITKRSLMQPRRNEESAREILNVIECILDHNPIGASNRIVQHILNSADKAGVL
jgi:DNA-binding GntR family transcriptional regulator